MIIESIRIKNFLPFRNEVVINFSQDKENNITLISAENNVGKSSLLKAFIWCLYGHDKADGDDVLNDEVEVDLFEGKPGNFARVEVEMRIEHEQKEYDLLRCWTYTSTSGRRLSVTKNFEMNSLDEFGSSCPLDGSVVEDTIKMMLPEDLSNYFFFEEKKFSQIGARGSIKRSVEDFCGITVLNNAANDLKKAIPLFGDNLSDDNDSVILKRRNEIRELTKELEKYERIEQDATKEYQYFDSQRDQKNLELMSHATDVKDRELYKSESEHKEKLERDLPLTINEIFKNLNSDPVSYLSTFPDFQQTLEIINSVDNGEGLSTISGITEKSIDEIMNRGFCVCGTKIIRGSKEYSHLEKERTKVPPRSVSDLSKSYASLLLKAKDSSKDYKSNLDNSYKTIHNLLTAIDNSENKLLQLRDRVERSADTDAIKEEIAEFTYQRDENFKKMKAAQGKCGELRNKIDHDENQIDLLMKKNDKFKIALKRREYAQAIYASIMKDIKVKQSGTLEMMNEIVDGYFKKIYHGNMKLKIDEEYNITIFNDYKEKVIDSKLSTGTNDVKNFAFVFGLEDLAKSVLNDSEQEKRNEAYPLILDAPFSHMDEGHMQNLCGLLPSVSNQIILAVSDKDWELTRKYLEKHLGVAYRMKKTSEQSTSIYKVEGK